MGTSLAADEWINWGIAHPAGSASDRESMTTALTKFNRTGGQGLGQTSRIDANGYGGTAIGRTALSGRVGLHVAKAGRAGTPHCTASAQLSQVFRHAGHGFLGFCLSSFSVQMIRHAPGQPVGASSDQP